MFITLPGGYSLYTTDIIEDSTEDCLEEFHQEVQKLEIEEEIGRARFDGEAFYEEISMLSVFGDFGTLIEEDLTLADNLGREFLNPALLRQRKRATLCGINPETGFPDRTLPGLPAEDEEMFAQRIALNGEHDSFFARSMPIEDLEHKLGYSLRTREEAPV